MNTPQALSIIRNILQYGGGFITGTGFLTTTEWDTAIGIIMGLIGLGWSMYDRRTAKLVADAAKQPAVEAITVKDGATARAAIRAGADAFTINAAT